MDLADLDYDLPEQAIAQHPIDPRDAARLLVDRGPGSPPEHCHVRDLAGLLRAGDVLVLNDTRVRPARVRLHKESGAEVELLLLEQDHAGRWNALVRPSRKVKAGTVLLDSEGRRCAEVGEDLGGGERIVEFLPGVDPTELGEVPLPPYIHEHLDDPERYQTVYARRPASAAAPTAGLHLTDEVLGACRARGIEIVSIELVVGLDTFRPITTVKVEDHVIHSEHYIVPPAAWAAVQAAERVVAVGTTVVRALESVAATGALAGRTRLFITPGFDWKVVGGLLTNFHVPRTSLLALVSAFVGPRWRDLYATALAEGYRFLSFGDAMLLERQDLVDPAES